MLTLQIHDPDYETMITPYKENKNKLWNLILHQLNVKEWDWKKLNKK
jgi:hypothetical protein